MTAPDLTPNQVAQLQALYDAAALARGSSRPVVLLRPGNVNVLGILQHHGLVGSHIIRRGRQWPEYWITPAGVAALRELATGHPQQKDQACG